MTGNSAQRQQGDLDREARLPLIAVIAVHGVADQGPNDSARQIAELLLRQRYENEETKYTSFREYALRIPVDAPLKKCDVSTCAVREPGEGNGPHPSAEPDLDLTHCLLHEYDTDRAPYDTVRLEGHRLHAAHDTEEQDSWIARDQCHVHVYELFWADLSRLGTGLTAFVGAVYQLISSLAQLGLRTIKLARQAEDGSRRSKAWRLYLTSHRLAVWLLTVVIPFLNLTILGAALTILVARLPKNTQAALFALVAVLIFLGVRTYFRLKRRKTSEATERTKGPSAWLLIVAAVLGAALAFTLATLASALVIMQLAVCIWILLQSLALIFLASVFGKRIATALAVGCIVTGISAAALLYLTIRAGDTVEISRGVVTTIEGTFWVLSFTWILLTLLGMVSALTALIVHSVVARRAKKAADQRNPKPSPADVSREVDDAVHRVKRSTWTAASTLAISTASLSALALFVWSALYAILSASLPAPNPALVRRTPAYLTDSSHEPVVMRLTTPDTSYGYWPPILTHRLLAKASPDVCFDARVFPGTTPPGRVVECGLFSLKSILRTLLSVSAMAGLLVNGLALCLTGAVGLWLALPSILYELRPQSDRGVARSRALGKWLSDGFNSLRGAAHLVYGLIFVGTGIVIALALYVYFARGATASPILAFFEFLQPQSDVFLFGIGSLIAASTVGVVALLTRIEGWSKVFRPVLDVSLDVDNYLKTRPVRRTPRARMLERFVALLRYLTRWRRDGVGYDAIIIIAHSQGTVLTSELLRYQSASNRGFDDLDLTKGYPWSGPDGVTRLTELNVDFLTMGSPLRQLYASSFPVLFHWTRIVDGEDRPAIGRAFCKQLGLRRWWNVYRSGDYVGRALWRYRGAADHFDYTEWCYGDACWERCLGPGAHTHYWNENAEDVGSQLDRMILLAYEASPRKNRELGTGSPN